MAGKNETDLGSKPIGSLLVSLAVPTITAQIVNMLYNIVDRIYIGRGVSRLALTGVGVTFPILILISAFSSLIGMGGAPRASIRMGRQDNKGAEEILGSCFVTLLCISLVLTVLFRTFSEPLLMMFGASQDTLPYGLAYINIYVLGTVFVQLSLGLNAFITAQGHSRYSMTTILIGAVANIILDPIFIFGLKMGVHGAALASVLSQALATSWVLRFLHGRVTSLRLRREYLRISPRIILPVLALGISPFIMQSTESLINIVFNRSLQRYGGDTAVGSMTILTSVMQLIMMPVSGLAQGAQPIISYNYGAQKLDRVKKAFRLLLCSALCYTVFFWLIAQFFPEMIVSIFNSEPQLLETASWALRIYLGAAFMLGAQMACQQTFVALGQAKYSLFLALLRKIFLLLPLIWLLPKLIADQVFAVFLAEPVADLLATLTTLTIFLHQFPKLLAENQKGTGS
ncbi:MAG: MATE family efflux transporter [Oscillospiraceae bacterium]|nr:MAG: MATE family efflux transporter [Oscillospiraceae bacterium]